MNLIIDIGNTRTKVALCAGGFKVSEFVFDQLELGDLQNLLVKYPELSACIVSETGAVEDVVLLELKKHFNQFIYLDYLTPLPLINSYHTPETLGRDRLAAAVGANALFPDQSILVIDLGTAITSEVIQKGVYLGGSISPGLQTRFKSLHQNTDKLPLLEPGLRFSYPGKSTFESIQAGVIQGLEFEINGFIELIKETDPKTQVIFTGGDAEFFANKIKSSIFVENDLVLKGLNTILIHNKRELDNE